MKELNEIYKGNCIDLVKDLKDKSIDCVITSPPYYNSSHKYQRGDGYHYTSDVGEPLYVIQDFFHNLKPKLKENATICLNLGYSYGETGVMRPFDIINRLRDKEGYFINDIIIWHKNNPIPIKKRLTNAIEYIFIMGNKPQNKYYTKEYTHNVFRFPVSKGGTNHNAVFPLELPLLCLKHFTKTNDLVLDPFMGSGTTAIACIKTNRKYIGFEINQEYVSIANNLIKKENNQLKFQL
jgi:DNA modification methylase